MVAATGTARTDAVVRVVVGGLLWLGLLMVTYWWEADGGVRDLGAWASGLTSAGRLTGLAASVLLLAQVVLMARVPVLERAYGQDRLARGHRLVGFTSFNLMLAHLVLITWGYAAGQVTRTPATWWDLVVNYPGMLLATGGTVALVMVVVTSIKAARARLRYESWHLMHLYAYLGIGLALPTSSGPVSRSPPPPAAPCSGGPRGRWPPEPCWSGGSASPWPSTSATASG